MVRINDYGRFAAVVCLLTGCQGGPRVNGYIESMAAERRALEDRVYQLEYDLDIVQTELEQERAANQKLRGGSGGAGNDTPGRTSPRPTSPRSTSPRRSSSPPKRDLPPVGDESILKPPTIEPGDAENDPEPPSAPPRNFPPGAADAPRTTPLGPPPGAAPRPTAPAEKLPPPMGGPPPQARRLIAPPPRNDAPAEPRPEELDGDEMQPEATGDDAPLTPPLTTTSGTTGVANANVASLTLVPQLTGGVELDDAPGDDGVTVALDLRDEDGRSVTLPGPVTVVLLDLAQQGPAARVARWALDAEQVQRLLPDGPSDEGLVLHMAWPQDPPKREKLQLHVRYLTPDGRKLEAHRDIIVRLPGQKVSAASGAAPAGGWRPKTGGRGGESNGVVPASAQAPLPPLSLPPLPATPTRRADAEKAAERDAPRVAAPPARPAWRAER